MKHLKKLTLLHSNDMHGDFMAKEVDDRLIGGVSMLSGYVGKVRREERNVVYSISGFSAPFESAYAEFFCQFFAVSRDLTGI